MTRRGRLRLIIVGAGGVLLFGIAFVWFQFFLAGTDYPRDTTARADLLSLKTQLELYKQINGSYPSMAQG
jgi:hypothetical protein